MKTCGQCKNYTDQCTRRAQCPVPMWMKASFARFNEMMRALLLPTTDASTCETFEEREKQKGQP